ncbi:hypothetical protein [Variovorax sp. HJSM1_2]|uniref:hypothetical protein n=1 Tax=Variovorax sp. HJSM1_2 TaxID=3366263 RepID=UPI003BE36CEA
MLAVLLATLAVLSVVFFMLFRGIHQEMVARAEAEDHLQRLNTELEEPVRARTADLECNRPSCAG